MILYNTRLQNGLPELIREKSVESPHQVITCAEHVYQICKEALELHTRTEEYVYLFAINTTGTILGCFEVSHGTVSCTVVTPREILMKLLLIGAVSFTLAHNHPSGKAEASREDRILTAQLREAGRLLGIKLLDHIVIGDSCYYSFREEGILE